MTDSDDGLNYDIGQSDDSKALYQIPTKQDHAYVSIKSQIHAESVELPGLQLLPENDEMVDSINTLVEGVSCLHDDNVQLFTNMSKLQQQVIDQQKQIDRMAKMLDDSIQITKAAQLNSHMLQTELDTMKELISNGSNHASNDGTFLWKISDVSKKLAAAMNDQQTSVYSPAFYTSPSGYKMCMRLYLNGDGQARRTHLSLFLVILRGDHDAVLPWPFTHKISFCLYDQTVAQRHVLDSFRPDAQSNSFQRPRSNMNIASGIPRFFPLTVIQQDNNPYVRDDSMFIRCLIDFSSIPKPVLPFVCNLNPSLPQQIRERLIQEEIERFNSKKTQIDNPVAPTEEVNVVTSSWQISEQPPIVR